MKKLIVILCSALFLVACNKKTEAKNDGNDIKIPEKIFGSIDKATAVSVLDAKKLKAGDEVTVTGKIMGNDNPFVKDRAMFIIGDPSLLKSCDTRPGDTCPTPWDNCCDDPKDIVKGTLSIQLLDKDQAIFKTGLEGKNGLEKLSTVVIKGKIAEADENSTVVTAELISVVK